ncbi:MULTISPECIES: helix-turn-helix transcriptional regulator [unclassified Granulicatella]|uniref:helix-turn-helix domain-containing protein n=1 Tax=unclassified Granulicatella TaxID=2630493 RepID=UPI00107398E7|nr:MULTISPECIES: helix-turn-helix transcriptional regulator [unclassified Granulicatella]MBF0779788.1 helix-turn-helix transcriptional regulator [Granulicatella sp. 19428wC4_WM01]TFU96190.1 XRE family transcriptional regulator [Granulicatella sp. WM01]
MFERLKELADKRGISLSDLATSLGFAEKSIYGWKKVKPSIDKIQAVADFFNVSTDYLLGREHSSTHQTYAQFFRVDTSDLTDSEKREFEEEMAAMSRFIAERIRAKKSKK